MRTPRHFTSLSYDVEERLKEYLSESTLQRLWQYKSGYNTVAVHTLNVLSRYVGCGDWDSFCKNLKTSSLEESEMFDGGAINAADLPVGTLVKIGWRPDRLCTIKYLGNCRFEAVETHNAKLCAGDTFTCVQLQLGRELNLDNLVRGESDLRYVIGSRNGLTTLEIIS